MAKKKKRTRGINNTASGGYMNLPNMTRQDLKRFAIEHGASFLETCELDNPGLYSKCKELWNIDPIPKRGRLEEYDAWVKEQLKGNKDFNSLTHPDLNLARTEEKPKMSLKERLRAKRLKKESKPKKEKKEKLPKDERFGLRPGSKKYSVFKLVFDGKSDMWVKKKVTKEYPDISKKTLRIALSKARKAYAAYKK